MRVLHVTNMYPFEGYRKFGAFVKAQVDSLAGAGVDCEVWFVNGLEDGKRYLWAGAEAVGRAARGAHGFDLVHVHYGRNLLWSWPLRLRVPMVVSFCGGDVFGEAGPQGPTRKSLAFAHAGMAAARICDLVIVKSAQMLPHFGAHKRVELLPNGVDFQLFRPLDRAEACRAVGWDPNRRWVLFPNHPSIRYLRRYDVLEEAVRLVQQTRPDVELAAVHDQPHERMPLFMSAADCMVLASMSEGSPNTVKEAMACNLPVVAVDVGDVAKTVSRVAGCHLVERTPEAFARAILDVVERGERTRGREIIDHLRLERVAERLAGLYREVLA